MSFTIDKNQSPYSVPRSNNPETKTLLIFTQSALDLPKKCHLNEDQNLLNLGKSSCVSGQRHKLR